jgi:hypothetical protein
MLGNGLQDVLWHMGNMNRSNVDGGVTANEISLLENNTTNFWSIAKAFGNA